MPFWRNNAILTELGFTVLSLNNISTSRDLLTLSQYIKEFKNYIFEITRLKDYTSKDYTWRSNSNFRNDKNYVGGKNGYTDEALHTLIAGFKLPLSEFDEKNIVIILLHSNKTERDVRDIIFWLLNNVYFENDF